MFGDDKVVKNQNLVTLQWMPAVEFSAGWWQFLKLYTVGVWWCWKGTDVGRLLFNQVGGDGDGGSNGCQSLCNGDEYILVVGTATRTTLLPESQVQMGIKLAAIC